MKAAYIEQTGRPEKITYGRLPKPEPTGSQVLVKIGAVSVNPIDTYIRSGDVKMDLPSPYILGSDLAGVVEAVGPDVMRLNVGDRVWGATRASWDVREPSPSTPPSTNAGYIRLPKMSATWTRPPWPW